MKEDHAGGCERQVRLTASDQSPGTVLCGRFGKRKQTLSGARSAGSAEVNRIEWLSAIDRPDGQDRPDGRRRESRNNRARCKASRPVEIWRGIRFTKSHIFRVLLSVQSVRSVQSVNRGIRTGPVPIRTARLPFFHKKAKI